MEKILRAVVPLLTRTDKVMVPIKIIYDHNEDTANPNSQITLLYDGVEYKGTGTDDLWTDTLADLEKRLPEDVKIACCMTCCHGNMCPYGNTENQLFCTKDLKITSKEDLCNLFDQTDPFEERVVASLDYCDDFVYQSDDCYTYNDYLYQLNMIGTRFLIGEMCDELEASQ